MPLIDTFLGVRATFVFAATGAPGDPGTWTPPAITGQPNSTFVAVAYGGAAKGGNVNAFTPVFVFPGAWTAVAQQAPGSNGNTQVATIQGANVPASAITWTKGGTPNNDIILIAILEYYAGKPALTRQQTATGNSPQTIAGAAAGFGNNVDEYVVAQIGENDTKDPIIETWVLTLAGGGIVVDYKAGTNGGTLIVFGRRPYTTAAGSTATTLTITGSSTLQNVGGASWLTNTCGAAGSVGAGRCQPNGTFTVDPSSGKHLRGVGGGSGGKGGSGKNAVSGFTVDPFGGFAPGRWPPTY